MPKSALTGMDILRLALERADDAESAVRVMVGLLETHGQGGGCGHEHPRFTYHNSFLIADPTRAIVLETAGRAWATEEVRGGRSISNALDDPGICRKAFGPHPDLGLGCPAARFADAMPGRVGPHAGDMAAILRDHGAGRSEPHYSTVNGGLNAPCAHAGGGILAASQTVGSWIAELSPSSIRHWATGTAAPCCGIFKPVRVDEPLEIGPTPTDRADDRSLWWQGERLHRQIIRNPPAFLPKLSAERAAMETAWFEAPVDPAEAFREAAGFTERWITAAESAFAQNASADIRPASVRRYWDKRNQRADLRWAGLRASAIGSTSR